MIAAPAPHWVCDPIIRGSAPYCEYIREDGKNRWYVWDEGVYDVLARVSFLTIDDVLYFVEGTYAGPTKPEVETDLVVLYFEMGPNEFYWLLLENLE